MPKLVVPSRSGELDAIELDVAAGSGELHRREFTSRPTWVVMPRWWVALKSTKLSIL